MKWWSCPWDLRHSPGKIEAAWLMLQAHFPEGSSGFYTMSGASIIARGIISYTVAGQADSDGTIKNILNSVDKQYDPCQVMAAHARTIDFF